MCVRVIQRSAPPDPPSRSVLAHPLFFPIATLPPRQELILSFNRISGAGAAALAAALGNPRCRVVHLSLAQNGIGRRGAEHLGEMLRGGAGGGERGQVREEWVVVNCWCCCCRWLYGWKWFILGSRVCWSSVESLQFVKISLSGPKQSTSTPSKVITAFPYNNAQTVLPQLAALSLASPPFTHKYYREKIVTALPMYTQRDTVYSTSTGIR